MHRAFLFRVILLVVLIAVTGLLVVWSFSREGLVLARFTFIITWLSLIAGLIFFISRTNRTLKVFMDSLRYLDRVRVRKGRGQLYEELDKIYNEVLGVIQRTELEKETQHQYFRAVIENAGAGILVFDDSGKILTVNSEFRSLTGIRNPEHISMLADVSPQLPDILVNLKPGKHKLIRASIRSETVGLWLKMAEIRLEGSRIRLVSLQNIQPELEDEEVEAWQKLIRVLTHEIMNSVTPVNSLTNTIIRMLEKEGRPKDPRQIDTTTLNNVLEGLHSIEKRNKGLIGFVQSYRSLTRIQKPAFSDVDVNVVLLRIANLIKNETESKGIRMIVDTYREPLWINADEKLLEQVLINLINNAVYAVQQVSESVILLTAQKRREEICVEVTDNGEGIPAEIMNSIFIPFYTTKQEGSGIGLSLCRQIMRVHGGTITVRSGSGETVFMLKFPGL